MKGGVGHLLSTPRHCPGHLLPVGRPQRLRQGQQRGLGGGPGRPSGRPPRPQPKWGLLPGQAAGAPSQKKPVGPTACGLGSAGVSHSPHPSARVSFLPAHSPARRVRSCPGSPSARLSRHAARPVATLAWAESSSWDPAADLAPSPHPQWRPLTGVRAQPSALAVCEGLEPGTATPSPAVLCGWPPARGWPWL